MSKIINILSWLFLLTGMGIMMGFSSEKRGQQSFSELQISINKPSQSRFVTKENIENMFSNLGYGLENQNIDDIDIRQLEVLLSNKPSISQANVHKTISGKVVIQVTEREPIIRIYNRFGESFYLDRKGGLMPLSNQYSARVLIANGDINIPYSTVYKLEKLEKQINPIFRKSNTNAVQNTALMQKLKVNEDEYPGANQLHGLFQLAKFVDQNDFWKAQISQVYISENGDFELAPRVGGHNIIFGSSTNLEAKFEKLMTFYKKGLSRTGWNEYSVINLKFKNQVVCTKR
jgi:cell division protein FtsQ